MKKILDYALENENRQQADTTVLQIDLIKTRELIAAQRADQNQILAFSTQLVWHLCVPKYFSAEWKSTASLRRN